VHDLQAGGRPPAFELVGVDLGAAGVVVVEVAPGEHVDLADTTSDDLGDEGLDLGADVLTFRRHGGATYRAG
jgi:hypothetical protein